MNTVAERLKYAREKHKDWSQGQLAVNAGLTPAAISNIERGIRLSKGSLPQLAEALGISHKWLAYGEGEMQMDKNNPPVQAANDPPIYSGLADSLAELFDNLPKDDPVLRSAVYSEVSKVIRHALGRLPSDQPTPQPQSDLETPAATPQPPKARHK